MAAGTPILRLLGAFLCPALIYTNLITFSEDAPLRTGQEDLQELDSLDTEKSLLYGLRSRVEELVEPPRVQGDRGPRAAFLLTRWRKFWGAPVTVFLGNVVMYFAFLFLFTYVLLVDFRPPPQGPSGPEVTLYFWVFTLVLEEIRQVGGHTSLVPSTQRLPVGQPKLGSALSGWGSPSVEQEQHGGLPSSQSLVALILVED
ncbi:Transient receptor putative cation channel sub M member 5 [Saguinus oedipus]|uniref:Transient receptor putative cation channel sub M member 5 n=1 Tax=Saguinus oedipus TaxID=9490 RepID=A0ABQ9UUE5_SAGOE|nr:Transient receptor putative cation channel sub M member 5 [Saguinus oedipus]